MQVPAVTGIRKHDAERANIRIEFGMNAGRRSVHAENAIRSTEQDLNVETEERAEERIMAASNNQQWIRVFPCDLAR